MPQVSKSKSKAKTKRVTRSKAATRSKTAPPSKSSTSKAATRSKTSARKTPARSRTQPPMDAISVLKRDHRTVEDLFKKFESGRGEVRAKQQIVTELIRELSVHAGIEEKVFYPAVKEQAKRKGHDLVLESLEEHHLVKVMLHELEGMSPEDERYEAKVHVLMENVLHHAKEEEKEMFPQARKVMSARELKDLGQDLEEAKKSAPTRPHPNAPDSPPASLITSPAAAVVDAGRDMLRDTKEELKDSFESAK